jgi:hypothetical protein
LFHVRYKNTLQIKKVKLSLQQAVEALQGCEMLRIPHCLESRLTYGGEDVGLKHQLRSTSQKHFNFCLWYLFPSEAE